MYFKNFLACAGLLVASNVSDVSFASCNCDDDGDVKCNASKCDNCDNKGKTESFDELLLPKLLPRLYVGVVGHGGLAVSKLGIY